MIAAGITLKSLYPKLHFEDVDQLIAKVEVVTIKNKTRQAKFSALVTHPSLFLQDGEAG